jgi:hypothetical protein
LRLWRLPTLDIDLAGAREKIAAALAFGCTDTAHPSLQIINANALTTKALVDLVSWAEDPASVDFLATADRALVDAQRIFATYGKLALKDESHHLGRYFGTRAFADSALLESGQRDVPLDAILQNARRAHSPADRRPAFGQIAGKYCEAYVHFLNAERSTGDLAIGAAQKAIEMGNEILTLSGCSSGVKIRAALLVEYASAIATGVGTPPPEALARIMEKPASPVREQLSRVGPRRWLGLPLN